MPDTDFPAIASRLCAACGMCCDGTLFQIVRLQPGDAPAALGKLGLKVRSRDGDFFMEQPCPALRDNCCTVYAQRPTRCRLFHCQQLRRVEAGESTAATALEMIHDTRELVQRVKDLLLQCGLREDGQALLERYARAMSTPVNALLEPELALARQDLENTMRKLRLQLSREFRPPPLAQGE